MDNTGTNEIRDPSTPDEVNVRLTPREPTWDPTLGVPVEASSGGTPRHRLVTIGDSLTHGFQSGAIFNTDLSYPAIVAWELGSYPQFRHPNYSGFGGLPLNIEVTVRELELKYGRTLDWRELPRALYFLRNLLDEIEDWWERGGGSQSPNAKGINHNLGVYGWDLRDALERNADRCLAEIDAPTDQLLSQIVENANQRAALRVLSSARSPEGPALTPLAAAKALGDEGSVGTGDDSETGGIETLIVFLGANNALSSVTELRVAWSEDGYDDVNEKEQFTVWRPSHFAREFDLVVEEIKKVRAQHVLWATVPHVTIAPIARGVTKSKVRPGSRYFPYYTRPWISDKDFDVRNDPYITAAQARAVDSAIDQYNDHIALRVKEARKENRDWYLVEIAGLLDRLASRRYLEDLAAIPDWWRPFDLPPDLRMLDPVPDSRFFQSGARGRMAGGLFSLDGVHPTTIGYGVLAQEFMNVMQLAGVPFRFRDDTTARPQPISVDFRRLILLDTLVSNPPESLSSNLQLIGWIDERLDVVRRLFWKGV